MLSRTERITYLEQHPEPEVLIIGAGINGIGTFRDLCLQGVYAVLVDRGDYCSGASAASSHMVHGGIRYLENGEFKLVREAVGERNRLIENAPHLVKPLPTTFPIFKRFSGLLNAPLKFLGLLERPAERGAVVIKIGMMVYDFYTRGQKTVPRHVFRNRTESLALFSQLNPKIIYTGTYYDGAMHSPERIAIELLKDALEANPGSIALNYAGFHESSRDTVVLVDVPSGRKIHLRPKIVINAAGPWIDLVNKSMGEASHYISGTKGSHLILDHPDLRSAVGGHEFFFENADGRIVLIYPIEDRVMIGTSDLRVDSPDGVVITEAEIEYFFEMISRVFPGIHVDRSQVVYSFSGVRPLQRSEKGAAGQISRDHRIGMLEPTMERHFPVLSLIGGKWTSFRAFSEQAADEVLRRLGRERKTSTADLEIGGSRGLPKTIEERLTLAERSAVSYQLPPDRMAALLETYGINAFEMSHRYADFLLDHLEHCPQIAAGEIAYLLDEEDILHLDDLLLRRTLLGKLGRVSSKGLEEIGQIVAAHLGWNPEKLAAEISRAKAIFLEKHRVTLAS